jgi:hypothetical protein
MKSIRRVCGGVFKPNITFFGEKISTKSIKSIQSDAENTDALIVIGSSLQVQPVSAIPVLVSKAIPQILINRNSIKLGNSQSHGGFDLELLGDCDDIITQLCQDLHWGVHQIMEEWDAVNPDLKSKGGGVFAPLGSIKIEEEGPRILRFTRSGGH